MPLIVYVFALGAFALITTELGVIGVLPQVAAGLGVTVQAAGWLLSSFALTIALAGPAMTLLFARVDRRFSLCLVLAAFTLANVGSAATSSFGILVLLRVLPALLHPVFWSMAMTAAAGSVPADRSHRATSIVFAGMSAGIVFGIPLASFCSDIAGWRAAFGAFAFLNLLALGAHLVFLPKSPPPERRALSSQLAILGRPSIWLSLVLQVALTAASFSIYGFMAEYLHAIAGLTPRQVSAMLLVFGGAGVVGTLVCGRLMAGSVDRTLALFLGAFGPLLLILSPSIRSGGFLVAIICWGVLHAMTVPLCQALVLRTAPDTPEFSNSLFNSFGNLGITMGTVIGGSVIARAGIERLPLASVVLLGCALPLFLLGRSLRQRTAYPGK